TETDSTNGKDCKRGVEDDANHKNYPTGNDSYCSAIDKGVKVTRRQRMQIDLQIPAQRQQSKDPKIIATETTTDSLPFGNCKVGRNQISCQVIRPGLVLWRTAGHQHLREVTSFQ